MKTLFACLALAQCFAIQANVKASGDPLKAERIVECAPDATAALLEEVRSLRAEVAALKAKGACSCAPGTRTCDGCQTGDKTCTCLATKAKPTGRAAAQAEADRTGKTLVSYDGWQTWSVEAPLVYQPPPVADTFPLIGMYTTYGQGTMGGCSSGSCGRR